MPQEPHKKEWSMAKIAVAAGIAASLATCVLAMPTAMGYVRAVISPWTTLPDKVDQMQRDITQIKKFLFRDNRHYHPPGNNPDDTPSSAMVNSK
jgi:hypothetical protein